MSSFHKPRLIAAICVMTVPLLALCGVAYLLSPDPGLPAPRMPSASETAVMQGHAPVEEQRGVDGVQVVIPTPHTTAVTGIEVSADGRYVLSEDTTGATKLWDVAGLKEIRTFIGVHAEFGRENQVVLYDPLKGALLYDPANDQQSILVKMWVGRIAAPFTGYFRSLLISADMRVAVSIPEPTVASVGAARLQVTDLARGQSFMLKSDALSELPVALSTDGSMLLSFATTQDGFGFEHQVWDLKNRAIRQKILQGTLQDRPILSGDGRFVAVQHTDCSIDLYELRENRKRILAPARPDCESLDSGMASVAISPDSTLLADKSAHGIDIYELPSGRKRQTIKMDQGRGGVSFSPDDRFLAQLDQFDRSNGNLVVWEIASGRLLINRKASAIAFSARDSAVLGLSSGSMILQNLASAQQVALGSGGGAVTELALTPDAKYLIAGSSTEAARLWDLTTGQLKRNLDCPNGAAAISVSTSSHAPLAATGCEDGSAWLWDLNAARQPSSLNPPSALPSASMAVRFSDDGQLVVVGRKEQITVWSVASNAQVREISLPRGALPASLQTSQEPQAGMLAYTHRVTSLAVQPAGHLIAINQPYQVSVWDIDTGRHVLDLDMTGSDRMEEVGARRVARRMGEQASLGFSADGGTLFARGRRWDIASGNEIRKPTETEAPPPRLTSHSSNKAYKEYMNYAREKLERVYAEGEESLVSGAITVVTPSHDGHLLFEGVGRTIRIVSVDTGVTLERFSGGHTGDIDALAVSADGKLLVSGAQDGSVRLWNMAEHREVAALIALGGTDFVTVTPDQFYRSSRSGLRGVSFRVADRLYPFEQFDLHSNRPDIILQRLGRVSNEELQSYHRAYERRLKKMGFNEATLSAEFHLPTAKITSAAPPATTDAKALKLRVSAADDKFPLDRINVFVNGVPVFGTGGLPVVNRPVQAFERDVEVPLVPGKNMIQVSALNSQGAESLKQTFYTQSSWDPGPGDVYIVAIGVSKYRDRTYDLRFAAKDAQDLIDAYTQAAGSARGRVHFLDLMNERATRDGIRAAKDWLKQSQPNDLAIVFAAGHGMMDAEQDYFLALTTLTQARRNSADFRTRTLNPCSTAFQL